MKKIAFLVLLSFFFISCEKEDKLPPNPEWLNTLISQLENSDLPGLAIYAFNWNEKYFYQVENPTSSVAFGDLFDYSGVRVVLTDEEFTDFQKNGKLIKTVWRKGV